MRRRGLQFTGLIFCVVLALPATILKAAPAQQEGVRWQHDLEAAKALAGQTGRLVLIHFWTPSCPPCENLEQNVLNQPSVAAALESRFVPVRLNANENTATAQGFGITRVPTDVILTPDGQVVGKLVSPPTPAGYVAEVTQAAAQHLPSREAMPRVVPTAPAPLNSAYADLPVAAGTPPAIVETGEARPDRYASAAPGAAAGALPVAITPIDAHYPPQQGAAGGFTAPSPAPPPRSETAKADTRQPTPDTRHPTPDTQHPTADSRQPIAPAPDPKLLPEGAPPLGFDGFCPVSMRNHWKWVPGDPRWGVIHRGRTYWFASEAEQQQFLADPDRYSPALSGMDPVLAIDHQQQVPGKREHSIDYDNLFYMFSSEATLQQFTASPERYATSVRQAMGIPRGRLVR